MTLSPKANLLRAIRHNSPAHVPNAGEGAWRLIDYRGRQPPREGTDEWGVTWAPLPESYLAGDAEPAHSYPVGHPASTAAGLPPERFPEPPEPECFSGLTEGIDCEQVLAIGQHPAGLLDRFISLLGMQGAMGALMGEPVATEAALSRIADYHVGVARQYLAAGAEAGWLADDYAGTSGPYLRPQLWQRTILPHLRRVIEVYRNAGAPVFFHTCGNSQAFVADLLDAGVTALNLQSSACDLAALKARFGGRISFFGGVASEVMLRGRPDEVREAVQLAIEALSGGGGLVLAPDQPLAFPAENLEAFDEAARDYCF